MKSSSFIAVLATWVPLGALGIGISNSQIDHNALVPHVQIAERVIFSSIGVCPASGPCPTTTTLSTLTTTSPEQTSQTYVISRISSTSSVITSMTAISTSATLILATSTSATPTDTSVGPLNFAITTTFTQPPECTGGITQVESPESLLWENAINPALSVTLTSCFPSQFYLSVMATASALPPFDPLICPDSWENYNINDTYVVCCPSEFQPFLPNYNNTERPGLGAVCASFVEPAGQIMEITKYNSDGLATVVTTTLAQPTGKTVTDIAVYAYAFDGLTAKPTNFTATAILTQTSTAVTSTIASLKSTTPSAIPTSGSSTRMAANSHRLLYFIAFIAFTGISV